MELKVAPASLHWSQPSLPHSPSSPQTLASAISSPSSKRRSFVAGDGALFCRYVAQSGPSQSSKLYRSQSRGNNRARIIKKALTASLDSFSDEEFSKKIQELALRFQLNDDVGDDVSAKMNGSLGSESENGDVSSNCDTKFLENRKLLDALGPPDFPERDEMIPLPLKIIKRKKQWPEGVTEAGESAYCSVKMAFSSMVFIIRELHSYTLQMREILFYENLQGILAYVNKEMHASFVWLFQKVFSQTPTLMLYVMILLANYGVYSLSSNAAIAASPPLQSCTVASELVSNIEVQSQSKTKFDSSVVRSLKLSPSSSGMAITVGGSGGGGGKFRPVASGTNGDGSFDGSKYYYQTSDGGSSRLNPSRNSGEESVSTREEEATLWNSIVEEASKMETGPRDEALDQAKRRFVSPVDARIESDDQSDYFKTELLYQTELAQEPNNPLLLANYAQFLYLVARDFDRAEEYFKRATKVEPKDAEALNKYANFLWMARNNLWAAEETYLEAISAEPDNTYYAANYAHFLWNTGGEDTCFPLSSPETTTDGGL